MANWNLQSTWDELYSIKIRNPAKPNYGQSVGYTREGMIAASNPYSDNLDFYIERIRTLLNRNDLTPNQDVLVIGCGLPFLVEVLMDNALWISLGYPAPNANVYGMDNSTLIQTLALTETPAVSTRLLLGNIFTSVSVLLTTLLRPVFGGNGRVGIVVTEDVLPDIADEDLATFFSQCEGLATNSGTIIHFVTCNDGSAIPPSFSTIGMFWRTLETYHALAPTHIFLSCNEGYRSLGGA